MEPEAHGHFTNDRVIFCLLYSYLIKKYGGDYTNYKTAKNTDDENEQEE